MDQAARVEFLRALIAVAWADGAVSPEERRELEATARDLGLDAAHMEVVLEAIDEPPVLDEIHLEGLSPEERRDLLHAARSLVHADRQVARGERELWQELKAKLRADGEAYDRRHPRGA